MLIPLLPLPPGPSSSLSTPPPLPRPSALWQKCLHRILNTPERTRKKEWYCGEHKYYKGKRTNEDDCKGKAHLPRDLKLVQLQKAANFSVPHVSPESSPPGKEIKILPWQEKNNLQNVPLLARRENANSWKLFEIDAAQQFVECWESDFTYLTPFHNIPAKLKTT